MEGLKDFKDMLARLECRNKRWRLALVCAEDESSRIAAQWALERKFVDIIFVGGSKIVIERRKTEEVCHTLEGGESGIARRGCSHSCRDGTQWRG